MMRPAKSRVRHGMASCARYGCKRAECVEARRRNRRQTDQNLREGQRFTVSAAKATRHAQALERAGMSTIDISERSGVSTTRVKQILQGRRERIYRTTEEALLGIPIPEDGWTPIRDGRTNAVGARRRLQALAVQGFPTSVLVEETRLDDRTISELRSGVRSQVQVSRLRLIIEVHDRLWDVDPLSMGVPSASVTRARQWAAKQNWYPTEAWADIDDPDCKPVLKTPRYIALTEDARELMAHQGYTRKGAAERLGVEVDTLNAAMAYYDRVKGKVAAS